MKLSGLKQYGTVRNLIRSCALASVIFFFVPAFSVSCAGHTETVGASHILKGIRYKGSEIIPAQPVLLLLPVLIYGAWHIRRFGERTCLLVCMGCSLGEFLGWILLYLRCRDMEDYGFRVQSDGGSCLLCRSSLAGCHLRPRPAYMDRKAFRG